uniref:Centromere protein W n=1 Tax=Oryctolagus cuniculus TaxID=9986 RepID=G1TMQ2_RABIT
MTSRSARARPPWGLSTQTSGASGGGACVGLRHYRAPSALRWRRIQTFGPGSWDRKNLGRGEVVFLSLDAVRCVEALEAQGCRSLKESMALSNRVSQKTKVKRKAPRGFLKRLFKRQKPHLRLEARGDLLVHLNCLLFVHRLAEESRTNACENKCGVINKDHVLAAAKVILKKSRDF